ncbi:conserved hypothetical protein [Virus Rctr85]|nr:conserved hypothetical protein [Virus Rctr85]
MATFITLGGEEKEHFPTGAQRGTQANKPLFHLIPIHVLNQLQQVHGGAPLEVDSTNPPIADLCPEDEVRRDLIPDEFLNRLGGLLHRGALKYGDNNWQQGILLLRVIASLFRHLILWMAGDTKEDHMIAVAWNAMVIVWTEIMIWRGVLPKELADAGPCANRFKEKMQ